MTPCAPSLSAMAVVRRSNNSITPAIPSPSPAKISGPKMPVSKSLMSFPIGDRMAVIVFHTPAKIVFRFSQMWTIFRRISSASIPAFSNMTPSTESLPSMNCTKSSTARMRSAIRAAIPSNFRLLTPNSALIPFRNVINAFAAARTLPHFIIRKNAPAAAEISLNRFQNPPNLSATAFTRLAISDTPVLTLFANRSIAGCNRFTIACTRSKACNRRLFSSVSPRIAFANFVAAFTPAFIQFVTVL